MNTNNQSLLDVENLSIEFKTLDGIVHAVNDVTFRMEQGDVLGIVGESGSGKSQLVLSMMGLLASNATVTGKIDFNGIDLLKLSKQELNRIRGNDITMIFQDPMTSLNPYLKISQQMTEVLQLHKHLSCEEALGQSIAMLDAVKIPEAKNRVHMYPHEFSGGMRQRVMIALALLCQPKLLIADEPTTALDVTVQAQIIELLKDIRNDFNTSIIMITHDLGVIAGLCDDVMVLYGGQIMEKASLDDTFYKPRHPYTRGLLRSIPRLDQDESEILYSIPGNPPNMLLGVTGCPFNDRCAERIEPCKSDIPVLRSLDDTHQLACHLKEFS